MDTIVCPYCEVEVKMTLVEAEGGCCPECGAVITASSIFNEDDFEDDFDGDVEGDIEDDFEDDLEDDKDDY